MKNLLLLLSVLLVGTWTAVAQSKHSPGSKYSTYDGLAMAGYQEWFRAPTNGVMYPDPKNIRIDMWPDVSEYEKTYLTGLKLADGSTAMFFSSTDKSPVDLHFFPAPNHG